MTWIVWLDWHGYGKMDFYLDYENFHFLETAIRYTFFCTVLRSKDTVVFLSSPLLFLHRQEESQYSSLGRKYLFFFATGKMKRTVAIRYSRF